MHLPTNRRTAADALPHPKPDISPAAPRSSRPLRHPPGDGVISDPTCPPMRRTACRLPPDALGFVLPRTTEQVAAILRHCNENGVDRPPRRRHLLAVLLLEDAVVIGLMRMNRILEIDSMTACCGRGRRHQHRHHQRSPGMAFLRPRPSSQLAYDRQRDDELRRRPLFEYGVTANNLYLKFVTIEGEIITIGGATSMPLAMTGFGLITAPKASSAWSPRSPSASSGPEAPAPARRLQGHRIAGAALTLSSPPASSRWPRTMDKPASRLRGLRPRRLP